MISIWLSKQGDNIHHRALESHRNKKSETDKRRSLLSIGLFLSVRSNK